MDWSDRLESYLKRFYSSELEAPLVRFKKLKTNYDRVDFFLARHPDLFLPGLERDYEQLFSPASTTTTTPTLGKSNALSDQYRSEGNKLFAKRDTGAAFKYYILAVLYAENGRTTHADRSDGAALAKARLEASRQLVLAYSNRSALFYDVGRFAECLKDLDSVYELLGLATITESVGDAKGGFDELFGLLVKLVVRKINCLVEKRQRRALESLSRQISDSGRREGVDVKDSDAGLAAILRLAAVDSRPETRQKLDQIRSAVERGLVAFDSATNGVEEVDGAGGDTWDQPEAQFIDERVSVEYSKEKGRFCVAKRPVQAGECLFVERPYCAILLPEFSLKYCAHCFKSLFDAATDTYAYANLVPCDGCVDLVYCSTACKRAHDAYCHRFECGVLESVLHNLGIAHLAYRIVASTDLEAIVRFADVDRQGGLVKSDELVRLLDYRAGARDDDYEQVFNLLTHEDKTHPEDLFKYSLTSILLAKHFEATVGARGISTVGLSRDCSIVTSAACLILRHLMQMICNAHAMTQLDDDHTSQSKTTTTFDRDQVRYATAIYPRVSLLNHSCNANIINSFRRDSSTLVVKAARSIAANEEIYNCYGPHYLKMDVFERRQALMDQYHFDCECEPCRCQLVGETYLDAGAGESDAPNGNGVKRRAAISDYVGLKCMRCCSMQMKLKQTVEIKNFTRYLVCESCKAEVGANEYFHKLRQINERFERSTRDKAAQQVAALDAILKEYRRYLMIDEQLRVLPNYKGLVNISEMFKLPYLNFTKVLDALARLSCESGEFGRASDLIDRNIQILRLIYSSSRSDSDSAESEETSPSPPLDGSKVHHIEIAQELFKLAEVQCNCQRFEQAFRNVNEAIEIGESLYTKDNKLLSEFYDLRNNISQILA